jgi:histone arginine demethylase JMJD6
MSEQAAILPSGPAVIETIDRRSKLSRREFYREYVKHERPVILTDAADRWPGMGKVTPQFIKERYGHLTKEIKGVEYSFADLVDRVMVSSPETPAPYPFSVNLEYYCPELLKEFRPQLVYGKMDRINHPLLPRFMTRGTVVYELFLGGRGASFPFLHYDALFMNTQITQVYGSKEFIMFSPDQTPYLYPSPENQKHSPVNVLEPDYERFPLFRKARPIRVTVQQGETLFFPKGWWHITQIHEPNITFGRAQLNGYNWKAYLKDEVRMWRGRNRLMATAVNIYGKLLGSMMDAQEALTVI